jgi:hypothetical protein
MQFQCDGSLAGRRQLEGDVLALVADFRRFTRQEHDCGDSAGWRFEVGWFTRHGGLVWAWFSREVGDGETTESK